MASPGTFHSVDAIVSEFRSQLAKRGGADGIRTLGLCFTLNDRDKSGSLDLDEFEQVLQRCSIFLKKHEISALFRYFDRNGDNKINYKEFLRGVQGKLSERRTALIQKAFAKIDVDGNGVLNLADIAKKYNTAKHPDVVTGKKTQKQVYEEFVKGFTDDGGVNQHQNGSDVTFDDFLSYYTDISASIPDNDDLFALMMCNCWQITEGAALPLPSADLTKFLATVKERVRQKCKGRNEKEHLRLSFKFFDLDGSGTVGYSEFLFALEKFGVVLDEKSSRGLFASMDTSGNGRLSYDEFAKALYDEGYTYSDAEKNAPEEWVGYVAGADDVKGPASPKKPNATATAAGAIAPKSILSNSGKQMLAASPVKPANGSPVQQPKFAATGNGFNGAAYGNAYANKPLSPTKANANIDSKHFAGGSPNPMVAAGARVASPKAYGGAAPVAVAAKPTAAAAPAAAAASAGPKPTVIFVLGGPGCGKGTQCERLLQEFKTLVHLSAGDLLRAEQENPNSPYGALIKQTIASGKLVPGDVTVNLIKRAIDANAAAGRSVFLVDGFPRNDENLKGWNNVVGDAVNVAFVLYLDCPEEVMTKRLMGRAQTSGRADDNAAVIAKRLAGFQSDTVPIVKQFATTGRVRIVNAVPTPDVVYKSVRAHVRDVFLATGKAK